MNILEFLKENIVILDGGMGTLLQSAGLKAGEHPERWNITHPEIVQKIHCDYYNAGSNVVNTNTFGANTLHFSCDELEEIVKAAVENAREAAKVSESQKEKYVALDIGPTGKLLKPYGDFDFEDAVSVFAETVKLGVKYGVDLIMIETMNDSYETKAALLAAKENSSLPVFVSNAYGEDGKLMTGASPAAIVAMLEGMGADAIGVNCSLGPKQLAGVVEEYISCASVPVLLKPNAGLPKSENCKTFYDVEPCEFAEDVKFLIEKGVRVAGGCCGTTPEYIKALSCKVNGLKPVSVADKNLSVVSSYTHAVVLGKSPILIGERINPTGKKRLKQALKENDIDYILSEAINQQDKGVHILDVNVGLPEIDEVEMLKKATFEIQSVSDLPLQIDTALPEAMESALRRYNGKAMINSVNGKEESMHAIFPLVKKYGGLVVALTLDEDGIPTTVDGRVNIAKNILATAKEYGIQKKDIIFDTLTMPISADKNAANVTLGSLKVIKDELGCNTSLGVSNVSFGLPNRDTVNGAFFAMALSNGLTAAIMNPYSTEMMKTYHTYRALCGMDDNCAEYISFTESYVPDTVATNTDVPQEKKDDYKSALQRAIAKGLKEQAAKLTSELLTETPALEIVQNEIIPALDIVGMGFEKNTVYLPQLLMSAEAAKSAFDVIKDNMAQSSESAASKAAVVIATVHGDIHDIGKNIVKLLLENYGFAVSDLGKNVAPETIVAEVVRLHAPIVGLSALMTTTVPAMEETTKQLRIAAPWCKVVVGGAVLTEEYAAQIGADKYAKDAMETVRYAESINNCQF
ncbi:MAG: homocysteine S-methyltransferase family protein [Clostridia bacterium]|nr:homocysteine S-methyltransferase family protein [Clostridia bacterium]